MCLYAHYRFVGRLKNRAQNVACYPYLAPDAGQNEDSQAQATQSSESSEKFKCIVYAWGLNDKGQLGLSGELKVKYPSFNPALSQLDVSQIVGGSKSLFVVTRDGKLYACGDSSNGRLGVGDILESQIVTSPRLVSSVSNYVIKKVAVSCGGKHSLALTSDGKVFSWGDNTDGKLGMIKSFCFMISSFLCLKF